MLNELAKEIHQVAVEHGWWDEGTDERRFPGQVALMHSELSEALEEYRSGNPLFYLGEGEKPEGVATEIIDCMIRCLDWLASAGVDIDKIMREKIDFNKTRPYRHGGKRC